MDTLYKLEALGSSAQYDVCGYCGPKTQSGIEKFPWRFIYRASLPGGKTIALLKVLLTNYCQNDCLYCVNQVNRDIPRYRFSPEELAALFISMHERRMVTGLFLSSGVAVSPGHTMSAMIETAEIVRRHYGFRGYIHLKILPGVPGEYIEAACRLANRVSVNIEAPNATYLAKLSSRKDFEKDIKQPMRVIKRIISNSEMSAPEGQTTQFVVGAAGETDVEIMRTFISLYGEIGLRRVYFSAFRPVGSAGESCIPPVSPLREYRLYQMDWLYRIYRFNPHELELSIGKDFNLSLSHDPKVVIAGKQPWLFPVDINQASYEELLRVPGIGPVSAKRIINARREHSIFSLQQLKKMGALVNRTKGFIRYQGMPSEDKQLSLIPVLDRTD